MLIFDNKQSLQIHLQSISAYSSTIGFVPTMGALHQGHLSLLAKSVSQNNVTIISIFVNPTQFNNSDDLDKYPRNINNDVRKINTVSTDIIVFTPAVVAKKFNSSRYSLVRSAFCFCVMSPTKMAVSCFFSVG